MEQERERKIERLRKRHALVLPTWLQELKMAKLRHNFATSAGHCHTFAAAPPVAYRSFHGPMWRRGLPLSGPFDPTFFFSCFIVVN